MTGTYQYFIEDLPELESYRYENIFKVYLTEDSHYFYNILKKIQVPDNLNPSVFDIITLTDVVPFTTLSYRLYGTTYLWWLICVLNGIKNPFDTSIRGMKLKVLKKQFIKVAIDSIKNQLQ